MRSAINKLFVVFTLVNLSACGTLGDGRKSPVIMSDAAVIELVKDDPINIGAPYSVDGITYTPADDPTYDDVGYAAFFSAERAGQLTANGEKLLPTAVTAAHRTLPMPSYVEVTAINTGRTILVRINDRGPGASDRLIELSESAASQLGLNTQEKAGVRVRRVNPPEQERAVLRQGGMAAERIETPESLLMVLKAKLAKSSQPVVTATPVTNGDSSAKAKTPAKRPSENMANAQNAKAINDTKVSSAKIASQGAYIIQIAAFSTRERADFLAKKLEASVSPVGTGGPFRVRLGPFVTRNEADQRLKIVQSKGYAQARIYRN